MNARRIYLAGGCVFGCWIYLMADNLLHGPISHLFGRDQVDHVIDLMFYAIEGAILAWTAAAMIVARRLGKNRRPTRVAVTHGAVNGQPVRLALDTGAFITLLTRQATRRLQLPAKRVSFIRVNFARGLLSLTQEAVRLTLGTQVMAAPLPVLNLRRFMRIKEFDGLLGWPEVRDNILLFDADQRVVRRLEELPPATAGWQRLKVHAANQLILEMPLANGETGLVLVDTGAPLGLALPEARMKAWRAAHPHAPATPLLMSLATLKAIPGVGLVDGMEVWADEITLGPLTLTDVPLRSASSVETRRRRNGIGALGLYALSRMDLIVDGINGFAYVRPRPGPGLPYPTIKRPGIPHGAAHALSDWTLAENVKIRDAHLLAFSALARAAEKKKMRDHAGALAECDRAIALDPGDAVGYQYRAFVRKGMSDFSGALADCDQILELDADNANVLLLRGMVYFARDDRAAANADFARARELGVGKWRIRWLRALARLSRWLHRDSPRRVEHGPVAREADTNAAEKNRPEPPAHPG